MLLNISKQNKTTDITKDIQYLSLTRVLLLFYLTIANNFTDNLFSKQLKTFLNDNRYAQHMIAFIMMLVFIMMIGGVSNIDTGIFYSVIFYTWFIFTTKLDIQLNIIIILLLFFGFIYESKLNEKENQINSDQSLSESTKESLIKTQQTNKMYILIAILSVTVIGSALYIKKQEVQYGGGFDLMRFLFF